MDGTPLTNANAVQHNTEIGPDARIVLNTTASSDAASDAGASTSPPFPPENTSPASQDGCAGRDASSLSRASDLEEINTQNQLLSRAIALRGQLDQAAASVCVQGQNALVIAAKQGLWTFRDIENTAQKLATKGFNAEANKLMMDTKKTYDHGLEELSTVHGTMRRITACMKEYANAIEARNTEKATRHVLQLQVFSEKLSTKSGQVQRELAQLLGDLDQKLRDLCQKYNLNKHMQTDCGHGAAAAVTLAGAATGGAAAVTAAVSVPAVAFACVAALGVAVFGAFADRYGAAKESTAKMGDITKNAHGATELNTDMWKGVALSAQAMRKDMDNLPDLGLEDAAVLHEAVLQSAKTLQRLVHCVDECIVFMAESELYPMSFDARTVVGKDEYESIRRMMIADVRTVDPQAA